ncbi:hypothetical protein HD554DRAFT_2034450 [Boletus coccyginus]|nr:hypothetical protein HD554DRAFT_2034450 [Boletus coccyginus]
MTGRMSETRGRKICLSCARWRAGVSVCRYVGLTVRAFACERLYGLVASLLTPADGEKHERRWDSDSGTVRSAGTSTTLHRAVRRRIARRVRVDLEYGVAVGSWNLTHNSSGVPIIVVCTKADLIDEGSDLVGTDVSGLGAMVKDGAALFYETPQPSTLNVLRQYTLRVLFTPPAPSPGMVTGTETSASIRNPFLFHHRPNTVDRDHIVAPAGWDSWGKIGVLREGFEARVWGEAWDTDLADASETKDAGGAKRMYRALVPDQGAKLSSVYQAVVAFSLFLPKAPSPLPPFNAPMAEQAFLVKHYDENSKKPDRYPRSAFRDPTETATAGIVGPLGSSSFSPPTAEKALADMETDFGSGSAMSANVNGDAARRLSRGEIKSEASSTLTDGVQIPGDPDLHPECTGEEQGKEGAPEPGDQSQDVLSPSGGASHTDEIDEMVITNESPPAFTPWSTTVALNGELKTNVHQSSDPSATACLQVYVSFELQPTSGAGEQLREVTILPWSNYWTAVQKTFRLSSSQWIPLLIHFGNCQTLEEREP